MVKTTFSTLACLTYSSGSGIGWADSHPRSLFPDIFPSQYILRTKISHSSVIDNRGVEPNVQGCSSLHPIFEPQATKGHFLSTQILASIYQLHTKFWGRSNAPGQKWKNTQAWPFFLRYLSILSRLVHTWCWAGLPWTSWGCPVPCGGYVPELDWAR